MATPRVLVMVSVAVMVAAVGFCSLLQRAAPGLGDGDATPSAAAQEPTVAPAPDSPTPAPAESQSAQMTGPDDSWQKGFAFWDKSATLASPESLRLLRQLEATGANTVSPVVTWYVADARDSRLHRTHRTASDQDLVAMIDQAHALGLQVVLTIHVDCENGEWRARINPDDKDAWFSAYGVVMNHYANLAQAHQVEGLIVGAELVSLTVPANTERWRTVIRNVRLRYSGFLTYSAQWGSGPPETTSDQFREFDQIGFWRDLDYLGISAYFELAQDGSSHPSPEQLQADWERWRRLQVEPFQARYGMPLLFTEVGYSSTNVAARHPWDVGAYSGANLVLQSELYSALFESWAGVPWFRGAYFWFWPSRPGESGPANLDYPPTDKPAESVLRRWYQRLDDMEAPD